MASGRRELRQTQLWRGVPAGQSEDGEEALGRALEEVASCPGLWGGFTLESKEKMDSVTLGRFWLTA